MFTPQQITTAIAVNACVDPNGMLGKYLGSMLKLKVEPDSLRLPQEDFMAVADKMIRNAIMADGVVSSDEQAVLDFIEQLKNDPGKQQQLQSELMAVLRGV